MSLILLLGACATDDAPQEFCDSDCPEPPEVMLSLEDLKYVYVQIDADHLTDLVAPAFTTFTLKFDPYANGGRVEGCPVIDPGLSVSIAGIPGRIKQAGGAYHGARWRCGDILLAFEPTIHAPAAKIEVTDGSETLSYDVGDALVERSVVPVDHADWALVRTVPNAFRWSPESDVANRNAVGIAWKDPWTITGFSLTPITHVDAATFEVTLPSGPTNTLWLSTSNERACGPNCRMYVSARTHHFATSAPPPS